MLSRLPPIFAMAVLAGVASGAESPSGYDPLWSLAELYKNPDNPLIQQLSLTGRVQFDYALIDGRGVRAGGPGAEEIDYDFGGLRRWRAGAKATLLHDFGLAVEVDIDPNEDPAYRRLTDANVTWNVSHDFRLKIGKQNAAVTQEGSTSSRELLTIDRSNLSNNLRFTKDFIPGVLASGETGPWSYRAGVFSQGRDDGEFGDFNAGVMWLGSLGYDLTKPLGADKAEVHIDLVINENTPDVGDLFTNRALSRIVSLNGRYEKGAFGLRGDLAAGEGYGNQSDLAGLMVMPYYNFTKKLQGVLRYTYLHSEEANGIRFARYENLALREPRGDLYQEGYAGLNYYLYGHKLKLQTGIEFVSMRDRANDGGDYHGWSWQSGIRISW